MRLKSVPRLASPAGHMRTASFDDHWVRASTTAPGIPEGGALASLLLGLPDAGGLNVNTNFTYQNYYFAWFLQDNWHARSNLTINAGLRFEHENPVTERYNRMVSGFDPTAVNQVTNAAEAAYAANPLTEPPLLQTPPPVNSFSAAGGVTYASSSHPAGFTEPGIFVSPRFGLAWAPHILHLRGI